TGKTQGPVVPITRGNRELGFVGGPQISPNGEWIVAVSGGAHEDIVVTRADGTSLLQLTDDEFRDRYPKWSPDSRRIAFSSNRSGSYEIYTVNRDGTGLQQMTDLKQTLIMLDWSPDGKYLIGGSSSAGVRIFDADGSRTDHTSEFLTPRPG